MNAKETMEALLAGKAVRPLDENGYPNGDGVFYLDDKGHLMLRWDRGHGETIAHNTLNFNCEVEGSRSDPKDILKALAEGRRIHSSCHASYWIDEYGFFYQQRDGDKSPTCLIDIGRCRVVKEEGEE